MTQRIHRINFFYLAVISLILINLSGCATSVHGSRNLSDIGRYTSLQKSVSTKKDVYIAFGQPHDTQYPDEKSSIWTYYQAKTSSSAATFIPFVGLLAGGVDSQTLTTAIVFDNNGLYERLTSKDVKKTTNMWSGMSRAGELAKDDKKAERVKNEMLKLKLPFDEQIAKSMGGVEVFADD
jgi:hypothetical protein